MILVLDGENNSELKSATDLANGDENLIAFLNGKQYVLPQGEPDQASFSEVSMDDVAGPSTSARGARSKTSQAKKPTVSADIPTSPSTDSVSEQVPASLRGNLFQTFLQ